MKKTIKCMQCDALFDVVYEIGDQGSLNACKRKYCSKSCKQAFNKTNLTSTRKIELTCQHCSKTFCRPISQSITAKFCSKECQKLSTCKFCSSCKSPISNRIVDSICYGCRLASRRVTYTCTMCLKTWQDLPSNPRKFCSRNCQWHAQSAGLIKLPIHGRCGFRVDLNDGNYYKSSLEADFARFCNHKGLIYHYEHKTFELLVNDKKVFYTPDFYLPDSNEYVEMKGNRHDGRYNSNLDCVETLKKLGVDIRVNLMTEFYNDIRGLGIQNIEGFDYNGTKSLIQLRPGHSNRSTRT